LHMLYKFSIQKGQVVQMPLTGFQVIFKLIIDLLEWDILLIKHIKLPMTLFDLIDSHIE
jgi:hypothetical protein